MKKNQLKSSTKIKTIYFSFCHPDFNPGGAQAIAKSLHDEHIKKHGVGSSLFIAANIQSGPTRSPGTNLLQINEFEFLYITNQFDYIFFTNYDHSGQLELINLIKSFNPTTLHFHHFMGFGTDFINAVLQSVNAKSIFTIHEHLLVCHNDGHLLQRKNNRICNTISMARCASCMPEFRYDYFHQRMRYFKHMIEKFDEITAVSNFTSSIIENTLNSKPIKVIPNGPYTDTPEEKYVNTDTLSISYIGQIHRTKGIHLILEALREISIESPELIKKISLTIWGSFVQEDYKEKITEEINTLHAKGFEIKLGGIYDSTNLKNILSDSNMVIVPSMWPESYCLTLDEAITLGKIVICADFPAARERYEQSEALQFVSPGSHAEIKKSILKILEKEKILIKYNRKFSFNNFTEIFNQYQNIYI